MHELEKYHEKAISSAQKNDFSKQVIDEINNYFSQKKSTMERCDACGEEMLTIIKMNDAKICKKCYSKIESKEWKNKNYTSREQLDIEKNKIIQIAQKSNYPKEAIKFINDTFESKVEKNWMYTIDGNAGQILKVYKDYFSINTTDVGDDTLGYLKFQNQNTIKNSDYDVLYFYDCDAKDDIIKLMPKVYSYMKKRINKKEKETNKENNSKTETNNSAIIEDIKKFKELLDMGAITQEEYDKKKKQLLDL